MSPGLGLPAAFRSHHAEEGGVGGDDQAETLTGTTKR